MRNPERIDVIVEAVRDAWKTVPDWRLGQLIVNIGRSVGKMDPFFLEDDDLLHILKGEDNAIETESALPASGMPGTDSGGNEIL